MMSQIRTKAQETAEDIFFGQVVIIWARWLIIFAAAILILWSATTVGELAGKILTVVALMGINFFLHGRYLVERPANPSLLLVISLLDLVIISTVALLWPAQRGLDSPFFVLYYPMLLAFAFVFPPRITAVYTLLALMIYASAGLLADPGFIFDGEGLETLATRLITLASMSALGAYYWRIQRDRRRSAVRGQAAIPNPGRGA